MIKIVSMFLESEDNKCFLCYEIPKDTPRMNQEGYFITKEELEQRDKEIAERAFGAAREETSYGVNRPGNDEYPTWNNFNDYWQQVTLKGENNG